MYNYGCFHCTNMNLKMAFTNIYCIFRYDSEGRLTNVTYPTGMVTSLHREIEKSINIDIESSNRDDDITVITNLSSVEASYTVVQGMSEFQFRVQKEDSVLSLLGFIFRFILNLIVLYISAYKRTQQDTDTPDIHVGGWKPKYCMIRCRKQHLFCLPCLALQLRFAVMHMIRDKFITLSQANIHCLPSALNHKPHCPKAYFIC